MIDYYFGYREKKVLRLKFFFVQPDLRALWLSTQCNNWSSFSVVGFVDFPRLELDLFDCCLLRTKDYGGNE